MKRISVSAFLLSVCCLTTFFLLPARAQQKNIVETAVAAGSFKTLATALGKAGLVEALQGKGPFTVFAPTDEAFNRLPKGTVAELIKPENKQLLVSILTYHVAPGKLPAHTLVKRSNLATLNGQQVDLNVRGKTLNVNNARVVKADIQCTNGVIHVIDRVIMPSSDNIIETAVKAGSFKTLATAIKAAGLVEALQSKGPFTVFAPTDEAFAKLPDSTLKSLLRPENKDKLAAILKYHVVPGRKFASEVVAVRSLATLEGSNISVRKDNGGVRINNAKLLKTDIDATNGVIHVIDSVLLPKKEKVSAADCLRMIVNAINKGAPMYNQGHPDACRDIYMNTIRELMSVKGDVINAHMRTRLTGAMRSIRHTHNVRRQAWILRHALDDVYDSMPTIQTSNR